MEPSGPPNTSPPSPSARPPAFGKVLPSAFTGGLSFAASFGTSTSAFGQPRNPFGPSASSFRFSNPAARAASTFGQPSLMPTSVSFLPVASLPQIPVAASSSAASEAEPAPVLGLRGRYSSSLRNREEWTPMGPTLSALGYVEEVSNALPTDSRFDLIY